jgi:hypothetical protein
MRIPKVEKKTEKYSTALNRIINIIKVLMKYFDTTNSINVLGNNIINVDT